jgi:putative dimethyl sulfoxide reductase chaperone
MARNPFVPAESPASSAIPHALLLRAALAQRLAACFRYPRDGMAASLREGVRSLQPPAAADPDLGPIVARFAAIVAGADDEALQAEYSRVFIGAGASPLHETAYGPARLTIAAELADVQGFYRAFGFRLSETMPEMADHLGAELEFHAALLVKMAWAALQEWQEPQETTTRAAAAFLDAHLGRWTRALARRLEVAAPGGLYARAATEVEAFVAAECARFGVAPVPLAPREGGGDAEAFTCPMAAECEAPRPGVTARSDSC